MDRMRIVLLAATVIAALAFFPAAPASAAASTGAANTAQKSQIADGTIKTLQGKIKADGDKLKFIEDGTGTVWELLSSDLAKKYVGQHVAITGHLFPSIGTIHVHEIKQLKK